jgi:chloramphenicol-sensitive protein RarD
MLFRAPGPQPWQKILSPHAAAGTGLNTTMGTMPQATAPLSRTGIACALSAFATWGLMPLYLREVAQLGALEVTLQRAWWALVCLLLLLAWRGRWQWLQHLRGSPKQVALFVAAAALLSGNWLLYVWAVNSGQVLQASLGYFINPLLSVMLGVLVLKERLRPAQWAAVGLAACGVLWLTVLAGSLPWIALVLALTFGVYGLLRKTSQLGPVEGLALETTLLMPAVLPALIWASLQPGSGLERVTGGDLRLLFWLALAGPITALPLVLFAAGARRLPLSILGLLQYVGPTLQFVLAVFVFHEAFDARKLVGFALIWAALALVSADTLGWLPGRKAAPRAA